MIYLKPHYLIAFSLVGIALSRDVAADVSFSGLTPAQEANARAVMTLAATDCDSAIWRVRRLFRDADTNLLRSLEALGYYDVEIAKTLNIEGDCWSADFDVTLGAPVELRQVDIQINGEAAGDGDFQSLLGSGRPASGNILNHRDYEAYKSTLLSAAISYGYFDADFARTEVVVDRDAYAADIHLTLQTGSRYKFGETRFDQEILDDNLLLGYSDIQAGDPYSSAAINSLYDSLNGSSYFNSVSINTEPLNAVEKTVPVTVALTPGVRRAYSIGAGFATDTGPKGRLGYTDRRRNTKGHQIESNLNVSPADSALTAAYRWPMRDPRKEWFSIGIGARVENTDTSENDTFKIGIQRSRAISKSWLETRYIDYTFENFEVADQDTSSELVIVGINWEAVNGRELSRTRNGSSLSFDVRGASDALGSDTSFVQFRSTATWIHSLGDKTRLLVRGGLGGTINDEFSELPVSVRFFAGGDRSIRGYDFESLGPVDASNDVIGASNLLTASVEIDRLFKANWALAAFIDSGSAFDDKDIDLSTGVGIGLRWYSPVGPVKLDFAHPLDDADQDFRVHIRLGPDL